MSGAGPEYDKTDLAIPLSLVGIRNVSGCDLVNILESVKSIRLAIFRQSLGSEETQALVPAMESGLVKVELNGHLGPDQVQCYSGQGKCNMVECNSDTADRYREQLMTWATSRNLRVTCDQSDQHDRYFVMEKM